MAKHVPKDMLLFWADGGVGIDADVAKTVQVVKAPKRFAAP